MPDAQPAHGAEIACEFDPVGAPGVFTAIAEVVGDISPWAVSRAVTVTTPHTKNIDTKVLGVPSRAPMSVEANFIFDNETHDHLTGVQALFWANTRTGFRFKGAPLADGTPTDTIIVSGQISNFKQMNPAVDGVRKAQFDIEASDVMYIGGVLFGT